MRLCVTLTRRLKGGCSITYLCALNGNSHWTLFIGLKQFEGIWEKVVFPVLLQRFWSSSSYIVHFSLFFKVISYTNTSDSCLDNPESRALTIIFTIKWSDDCFLNYLMNYLVYKASENSEKCPSQLYPRAQGDLFKCPKHQNLQWCKTEKQKILTSFEDMPEKFIIFCLKND